MFDLYDQKTGLSQDYMNEWYVILNIHELYEQGIFEREEYFAMLSKKIRRYEDYFMQQHPKFCQEAIEIADSPSLRLIDQIVTEYNSLGIEKKADKGLSKKIVKKILKIIKGEEDERQ